MLPSLARFPLARIGLAGLLGLTSAALPAVARPTAWEPLSPAPRVRLVAPAAGAVLTGGEVAEIAWEPAAPLAAEIEEWEAFLSLDGGATYPIRVTPHLDVRLRRATFQVPAVPTSRARLLLRFGDEAREAALAFPRGFSIRRPRARAPAAALAQPALSPGEPALPGARGVVLWAEGSRQGGATREVAAAGPAGLRPAFSPGAGKAEVALDAPTPPDPEPEVTASVIASPPVPRRTLASAGRRFARPAGSDLLLLLRRRNE